MNARAQEIESKVQDGSLHRVLAARETCPTWPALRTAFRVGSIWAGVFGASTKDGAGEADAVSKGEQARGKTGRNHPRLALW